MPAKNKSKVTDAQRRKIAAGKVTGKTAKTIAAEAGLAQRTVEKHAADARTMALIIGYKTRDEAELAAIWKLMIKRLKKDIDSTDADVRHRARMAFMKLLVLGEVPLGREDAPGAQDGDFTLEELLRVHRMDFVTIGMPR